MKRTALRRFTPLRPKAPKRPWRRAESDKVPDSEANYVFARDGMRCLAPLLDPDAGDCMGPLTLEHVKTESMMGRRAPSDRFHMLVLCNLHNCEWALTHKGLERDYLRRVQGVAA